MRVAVLQDQFEAVLAEAARIADARSPLQVLGNVLLRAEDDYLQVISTNLETTYVSRVGAKVDKPGAITLPAKTILEAVRKFSNERIDIVLDDATQTVNLRCGASRSNIKGIVATEFPAVKPVEGDQATVDALRLKAAVVRVLHAAAREDIRPILTGVCFESDGRVLTLAATDGYRLSVFTIETQFPVGQWVIPADPLRNFARIMTDDEVTLTFGDNKIALSQPGFELQVMRLEGKFPDFAGIIPKSYTTRFLVYNSDFLSAAERAEIFARDSNFSARLSARVPSAAGMPGELLVTGRSNERGDMDTSIDIEVEGDNLEFASNVTYLIDVLKAAVEERIVVESNGPAHPIVVRGEGNDHALEVIMPMQVGR